MKNGILHRYEEPKKVGDLEVRMIRKTPMSIVIHTNEGVRHFEITQEVYTEKELLDLLK